MRPACGWPGKMSFLHYSQLPVACTFPRCDSTSDQLGTFLCCIFFDPRSAIPWYLQCWHHTRSSPSYIFPVFTASDLSGAQCSLFPASSSIPHLPVFLATLALFTPNREGPFYKVSHGE